MLVRRLLAPAVWLTATVTAAALVSGAVRLALRSVSPPALASRPANAHHRDAAHSEAASAASLLTPPAAGGELGPAGDRLPVLDGSSDQGGRQQNGTTGAPSGGHGPLAASGGAGAAGAGGPAAAGRAPLPTDAASSGGASAGSGASGPGPAGPDGGGSSTAPPPTDTRRSTGSTSTSAPSSTTSTTTPRSATSSSTTSTTSSSSTTSTPQRSYVYQLDGGSVGVRCDGDTVSLTFASPNDGWTAQVVQSGPDLVDVRFQRDRSVSELKVSCSGGRADPHIDESGD